MDREPGGHDVGRDLERDFGGEPPPAIRDTPPDYRAPVDPSAPVSGHTPPTRSFSGVADSPEHDWGHAKQVIYPAFRPVGTKGLALDSIDPAMLAAHSAQSHAQPIIDEGPGGLPVVYTLTASGFDIVVNGDHLLAWAVDPAAIQDAAMRNLATWSAGAAWTAETSGARRLLSSETGDGWDAARILLPETIERLIGELGPHGRILVGVPERHLLTAGSLGPGDSEFAALFADFIIEHSGGADEPIDRRIFELVDGRLVVFAGVTPGL